MAEEVNASYAAYEWLEAKQAGAYEKLVSFILASDGIFVQRPDFVMAGVQPEPDAVHVVFAMGDLDAMRRFGRAYCKEFGIKRLSWCRDLAGKHKSIKTYLAERVYNGK